jgi:hypothetical protein
MHLSRLRRFAFLIAGLAHLPAPALNPITAVSSVRADLATLSAISGNANWI